MTNDPSITRDDRHELSAEIAVAQARVWAALTGDLNGRGRHVRVLDEEEPSHLRLVLNPHGGEQLTMDYRLEALGEELTLVVATVHCRGPIYALKRLLSFGRVDEGYLDAVAVGLANLQHHLEGEA